MEDLFPDRRAMVRGVTSWSAKLLIAFVWLLPRNALSRVAGRVASMTTMVFVGPASVRTSS